jgi:hypothetical protein
MHLWRHALGLSRRHIRSHELLVATGLRDKAFAVLGAVVLMVALPVACFTLRSVGRPLGTFIATTSRIDRVAHRVPP